MRIQIWRRESASACSAMAFWRLRSSTRINLASLATTFSTPTSGGRRFIARSCLRRSCSDFSSVRRKSCSRLASYAARRRCSASTNSCRWHCSAAMSWRSLRKHAVLRRMSFVLGISMGITRAMRPRLLADAPANSRRTMTRPGVAARAPPCIDDDECDSPASWAAGRLRTSRCAVGELAKVDVVGVGVVARCGCCDCPARPCFAVAGVLDDASETNDSSAADAVLPLRGTLAAPRDRVAAALVGDPVRISNKDAF